MFEKGVFVLESNEIVLVIDIGSPYNQMLMRKIREQGVYCEFKPHTVTADEVKELQHKAIILSIGPFTLHDEHAYRVDNAMYGLGIPMLGMCYGMQLIANEHGAKVTSNDERNYEVKELSMIGESPLVQNIENKQEVFYATGDVVETVPKGFTGLAKTTDGAIA